MNPYFFLSCLFFLTICSTKAQSDFTIHKKIDANQLSIRIEPNSLDAFQHLLNTELEIELYEQLGGFPDYELNRVESDQIVAEPMQQWQNELSGNAWDTIAITAIYGHELTPTFLEETFLSSEYEDDDASAWKHRWLFSNYALNFSWDAIENSGFGFRHRLSDNVDHFALKIYPDLEGDTIWVSIDKANYSAPAIPQLEAVFKDRRVELIWRTLEYRPYFFAWHLDRSLDGGQSWDPVFELPLINPHDTIPNVDEALKSLYFEDVLPENDLPVKYRLQGADYFGERSENFSIVEGEGNEEIRVSPMILETIQTDSNYAVIKWTFPDSQEKLLQEFRIIETDTAGQNYRLAVEGILPTTREYVIPMKFESNFFRVQAVSKSGTELTSFESLIMSYDVTPPATPRDFTGYIDSTGLAHFSWITSNEPDLAGYYLFKGYFQDQELAMITPQPLAGPTYVDTVNMEVGNELIYYQLRSIDYRGNGSAFTPVLILKKPDVFPPGAPQFLIAETRSGQVYLEWTESPSSDVERYDLYRRDLSEELDFTLIYSDDESGVDKSYLDSNVHSNKTYVYTILVQDDDDLESEPSKPVAVTVYDLSDGPLIQSFRAQLDDRSVVLDWEYEERPMMFNIYRARGEEPMILLKSLSGNARTFTDDQIQNNQTIRYRSQAIFSDGRRSPFTEVLEVISSTD